MSDYSATISCVDLEVDWAETQGGDVTVRTEGGDITEAKIFVNYENSTHHNSLELLGSWMESHQFASPDALVNELFEPGSEDKFTIREIQRPTKPGESGFADFDVGFDVTDSWCVETNKGTLPAKRIRLVMRVSLVATH
jgi:hypothetical protein